MNIVTEERTENKRREKYFLPYQVRYLQDTSRFKIVEKSRRIGFTYVEAYDDVRDAVKTPKLPTWFSSADESAAREYIMICEQWAKVFNVVAQNMGEMVMDEKHDVKAFVLEFRNGSRIHALRSNPRAFRSKGGKVILDEFAYHDDQEALWRAARPSITWGYPIRILSTHNGKGCRYYRMLDEARAKLMKGEKTAWSIHRVTLQQAVDEGLADKIMGRSLTPAERQAWIDEVQEFCCLPVDEATAFLT